MPGENHRGPKIVHYDQTQTDFFSNFLTIILVPPSTLHPQILILVGKNIELAISPDQCVPMTSRQEPSYKLIKLFLMAATACLCELTGLRSKEKNLTLGGSFWDQNRRRLFFFIDANAIARRPACPPSRALASMKKKRAALTRTFANLWPIYGHV